MSTGIRFPRERKAIVEAEETAGCLRRRIQIDLSAFTAFRTLVQGAGSDYDTVLDSLTRTLREADDLVALVRKARREHRALEKASPTKRPPRRKA